jgi:hypothetical protein
MRQQIFRTELIANGAIRNVLSPLAALLKPSIGPYVQ